MPLTAHVKFWRPDDIRPGDSVSIEKLELSSGFTLIHNANSSVSIEKQRQSLPVFKYRNHILYLVESCVVTLIVGETGSGKSTQIPQYLLEAGWCSEGYKVAVIQPRRVAAVTVASRVSEERGAVLGHEIGYNIRFDACFDKTASRIVFYTDGMLIRELMNNPLLIGYSVIMVDEAHERSLNMDLILGLLKKILKKRKDLRIVISSATLNISRFEQFFNDLRDISSEFESESIVGSLSVEGRMFPVDVYYTKQPVPDYCKAAVDAALKIHKYEPPGIHTVHVDRLKLFVLPMHSSLPHAAQMKVFERTPSNTRKVVAATNIAETSITIPGIAYVIDNCFVKLRAYDSRNSIEALVLTSISKSSAEQRSGRAGRLRAGKAFRLCTEKDYNSLPNETVPEMQRSDLSFAVLQMKALGIDNILRFPFLSSPPAQNLCRSLDLLYALDALDDHCKLTHPVGYQMVEFPLHPMFSKTLLCSGEFGCSEEILTICSMMQIQNIFLSNSKQRISVEKSRRKFGCKEGDHMTALNVYNAFLTSGKSSSFCKQHYLNYKGLQRATEIRYQLQRLLDKSGIKSLSCGDAPNTILRCLVKGFFANAARLDSFGEYRTVRENTPLQLHPTSILYAETPANWVVFGEVVQTRRQFMRDVSVIDGAWLSELVPSYYEEKMTFT